MANELELFWLDKIAKLWEQIEVPGWSGKVRSYRMVEKNEFPDVIEQFPAAISYILGALEVEYSVGGCDWILWRGVTEFHLVDGVSKSKLPFCMRFPKRIIAKAASSITLDGEVDTFLLVESNGYHVQGPVTLKYGEDGEHLGLVVNWVVKEIVSGEFTVSA